MYRRMADLVMPIRVMVGLDISSWYLRPCLGPIDWKRSSTRLSIPLGAIIDVG